MKRIKRNIIIGLMGTVGAVIGFFKLNSWNKKRCKKKADKYLEEFVMARDLFFDIQKLGNAYCTGKQYEELCDIADKYGEFFKIHKFYLKEEYPEKLSVPDIHVVPKV